VQTGTRCRVLRPLYVPSEKLLGISPIEDDGFKACVPKEKFRKVVGDRILNAAV